MPQINAVMSDEEKEELVDLLKYYSDGEIGLKDVVDFIEGLINDVISYIYPATKSERR